MWYAQANATIVDDGKSRAESSHSVAIATLLKKKHLNVIQNSAFAEVTNLYLTEYAKHRIF